MRTRVGLGFVGLASVFCAATQAQAADGFFCIFERENSSFQRVAAYREFGYSESTACYQAEAQCRRQMRRDQRCQKFSSGDYGWVDKEIEILCESRGGRRATCDLGGQALNEGRVYHTHSNTECKKGENWGVAVGATSLWVDEGCRADFRVRVRAYEEPDNIPFPEASDDYGRPNGPGNGGMNREIIRCASRFQNTEICYPQTMGKRIERAFLLREMPDSQGCREGSSFGVSNGGNLWVADGCKADFEVTLRSR